MSTLRRHLSRALSTLARIRRRLRRRSRAFPVIFLTIYMVSGTLALAGTESPWIRGWLEIALGFLHGLA
jgi:hypothetical protein